MSLRAVRRRRKLSMTSLIDVIFLLLLFFMLSSTFSRFAEVELQAAGGGDGVSWDTAMAFLRSAGDDMTLNGTPVEISDLERRMRDLQEQGPTVLLVSVTDDTSAQRLTDILVAVRGIADLPVSVLGAS